MSVQTAEIEDRRWNSAAAGAAAAGGLLGPPGGFGRAAPNAGKSVANTGGILVVDDTPANLQVLAGMLKDR